jgi:heptosyltransferase-3
MGGLSRVKPTFRDRSIQPNIRPVPLMPLGRIFKMMYWTFRKDWRTSPHLLAVTAGWLANLVALKLRGLTGRGMVVIGLVEHLGDIVAAEPIARLARRQYPDSRVAWVTRKPYASVPAAFVAVDTVVKVTCVTEWLLLDASGVGNPVWDLHINQRHCPRCQIPIQKIGAAGAIQPENYYEFGNLLEVECLLAGLPVLKDQPELPVDPTVVAAVDQLNLPPRFVVLHCASNEASRDWPRANWVALVSELLLEPGIAAVEIGSRAVAVTRDEADKRNLCGTLSIRQSAEVIRRAALFIGIDSGPAHLANAVGTPGVILLGNYRGFGAYMPYSGRYADGEGAEIVRVDGPMEALTVPPVLAAARRRLGRAPC